MYLHGGVAHYFQGMNQPCRTEATTAVQAAVKTELSFPNATIIAFFSAANETKDDTICDCNFFLKNKITIILPGHAHSMNYERVALPDAGDPFLAPNQKPRDVKCLRRIPLKARAITAKIIY